MEVEEYVDFRYEFVDGNKMEVRITGSSLNTSAKTLTPTLTITQWKFKWSLFTLFQVVGTDLAVTLHSGFTTIQRTQFKVHLQLEMDL